MKIFVDFIAFSWFLLSFPLFSAMLRSNQRQRKSSFAPSNTYRHHSIMLKLSPPIEQAEAEGKVVKKNKIHSV